MSLLLPRRRGQSSPIGGKLGLNRRHPHYDAVALAWHADAATGLYDMTGKFNFTMGSGGRFASTGAGMNGVLHNASNSGLRLVIPADYLSLFTGELTIFWRGVLLGTGSGYTNLATIHYGNAGSAPNNILGIQRGSADPTAIYGVGQVGGSNVNIVFNPLSTARYGIPCTIGMTNVVAVNPQIAILFDDGTYSQHIVSFGGASTRNTTTDNEISIGGYGSTDTTPYPNAITESVVILKRSQYTAATGSDAILQYQMRNYSSFFTTVGASKAAVDMFMVDPPPAEAGGSSGYKPFKGPFGHPFNVPF